MKGPNAISECSLILRLSRNKSGKTYLSLRNRFTHLKVNSIQSGSALLDVLNGSLLLVGSSATAQFEIAFTSCGQLEWILHMGKEGGKVVFRLLQLSSANQMPHQLKFEWTGGVDEFTEAVEDMIATSPLNTNAVLQQGFY